MNAPYGANISRVSLDTSPNGIRQYASQKPMVVERLVPVEFGSSALRFGVGHGSLAVAPLNGLTSIVTLCFYFASGMKCGFGWLDDDVLLSMYPFSTNV